MESIASVHNDGLLLTALNFIQNIPGLLKVYDVVRLVLRIFPELKNHLYEDEFKAVPVKFIVVPVTIVVADAGEVIFAVRGAGHGVEQLRQFNKLFRVVVKKYCMRSYCPDVNLI